MHGMGDGFSVYISIDTHRCVCVCVCVLADVSDDEQSSFLSVL